MFENSPGWLILIFALVEFWPVTLLVFVVSLAVAALTRGWVRMVFAVPAGLLLLIALGMAGYWASSSLHGRTLEQSYEHRLEELSVPRTIGGLDLPAGTRLLWADDAKTRLESAQLPHPARLWGVMISGEVKPNQEFWTTLTLAEDTVISGWACRAGEIELQLDGEVERCVLARNQGVSRIPAAERALSAALLLPAGAKFSLSPGSDSGAEFWLPDDRAVLLPDVGAKLPGGTMLHLYLNNAVRGVLPSREKPLVVDGIAFTSGTDWMYPEELAEGAYGPHTAATGVTGELQQEVRCAGKVYKPEDYPYVRVYTREKSLMFSYVRDDQAVRTAKIPLAQCKISPTAMEAESA